MNTTHTVLSLAGREVAAHLQSRWILVTGSLCAALSWAVAFHGFAFTGETPGHETVLVSLVHLQLYAVPLLGLLLAYDTLLGERESGMFDLHLALGIRPVEFLLGKWLGLWFSLWIALTPSAVLQAAGLLDTGGTIYQFVHFQAYAALLSGAIVSLGLALSGSSLNRGTVIALCIGAWIVQAVLLDLVVIGLLASSGGDVPTVVVDALTAAHPLGAYRQLNYLNFFPEQAVAAPHTSAASPAAAHAVLVAWILLPALAVHQRLARTYRAVPLAPAP